MPADTVPLFLGEAEVNLYYQAADGTAIIGTPLWFGCVASQVRMDEARESFDVASTGARGISTYQGNSVHRIDIGRVWVLPVQNNPPAMESVMTEFVPARNQRFVLQFSWLEKQYKLVHQRLYFGAVFRSLNLNSRGALQFDQRQLLSATYMEQNACGTVTQTLTFTVKIPIPQGQDYATINELALPWIPSGATATTESGASGVVIWAAAELNTLSVAGGTFSLSGEPIDADQVLVATFTAEWMGPGAYAGSVQNLTSVTVSVNLAEGQTVANVTGLSLPFVPSDAVAVTQNPITGAVIYATPEQNTLSSAGCVVNLSGAPVDPYQTMTVTFYASLPEV